MTAEFIDAATGTTVYINPRHVVSMRADAEDPLGVTVVKLEDGETLRHRGDHREVADRLTERAAAGTP